MAQKIYLVHFDHIFIQSLEPIRFKSEKALQRAIGEAVKNSPEHAQRTFDYDTLEEALVKIREITQDGYWQFDKGYTKPFNWYYFESEVAQIVVERLLDNGDYDDEPESKSEYYHPNIPFDSSDPLIIK